MDVFMHSCLSFSDWRVCASEVRSSADVCWDIQPWTLLAGILEAAGVCVKVDITVADAVVTWMRLNLFFCALTQPVLEVTYHLHTHNILTLDFMLDRYQSWHHLHTCARPAVTPQTDHVMFLMSCSEMQQLWPRGSRISSKLYVFPWQLQRMSNTCNIRFSPVRSFLLSVAHHCLTPV